jgi:protein-tyrosine phosphatase
MSSVLFVCLGNICRSPTAEGVFRALCRAEGVAEQLHIDSAGTGAWHVGEPPDSRAQAAARARGVDLSAQRARQVCDEDFLTFDYLLAMDRDNLAGLQSRCPVDQQHKLHLFLDFAQQPWTREVPDPYYGGEDGFSLVLDLIESASAGLLQHLRQQGLL